MYDDRAGEDPMFARFRPIAGVWILVLALIGGIFFPFSLLGLLAPASSAGQSGAHWLGTQEGFLFVGALGVYVLSQLGRLSQEFAALVGLADEDPETPVLSSLELFAVGCAVVGFGLTFLFYGPSFVSGCVTIRGATVCDTGETFDPATMSPVGFLLGVYFPLGWQIGAPTFYLSAPLLAIGRFAEMFAFTGDRSM